MELDRKINNFPDISVDGKWIKSFCNSNSGKYCQYVTHAARVWDSMNYRCKEGSKARKKSYSSCHNEFENFQDFADWCQTEQGYWEKDKAGKFWAIDKDVLILGNKVYSKETCCFVPPDVNNLIIYANKVRGSYPLGVSYHSKDKVLYAQCQNGDGKIVHLGKFENPMDGHRAWQAFKASVILQKAEKYVDYIKIKAGLKMHAEAILDDLRNQRETVRSVEYGISK